MRRANTVIWFCYFVILLTLITQLGGFQFWPFLKYDMYARPSKGPAMVFFASVVDSNGFHSRLRLRDFFAPLRILETHKILRRYLIGERDELGFCHKATAQFRERYRSRKEMVNARQIKFFIIQNKKRRKVATCPL